MTTYTAIPDSTIDADSPIDAALLALLRDNPIAMAEAASGAPLINPRALSHRYPGWLTWFGDGATPATINYAWSITPGEYKYTDFTLTSGGSMTINPAVNRSGIAIIRCTGRATIAGTITSSGTSPYTSTTARSAPYAGATASGGGGGGTDSEGGFPTPELSGGTGAAASAGNAGSSAAGGTFEQLLLHNLDMLSLGGAPGGDAMKTGTVDIGGRGGGVVIVVANEIDFTGTINCAGAAGTAGGFSNQSGAGGGGGGAIIMVTRSFINNTGTRNVAGGAGGASGGGTGYAGGAGGAGFTRNITVS